MAPFSGTVYDLADNVCLYEAKGVKIQKASASPKATRAARAFEKLLALGYRLITVIRKMKERRIKIWKDFQEMFSPCVINGTGQICKLKNIPRNFIYSNLCK